MASNLVDYLVTDDLTILLGLIGVTIFLLRSLYKPVPLVHPVLLGRQSDVTRVRQVGESAVYRNYGTGMMGRVCYLPRYLLGVEMIICAKFPLRPSKEIHLLSDLVGSDIPKTLWSSKVCFFHMLVLGYDLKTMSYRSTTRLSESAHQHSAPALRVPLIWYRMDLVSFSCSRTASVCFFLCLGVFLLFFSSRKCLEFIIADLALAALSVPSATLSSAALLLPYLKTHSPTAIITDSQLLPTLLEAIGNSGKIDRHAVVVVGEDMSRGVVTTQVNVFKWNDLEKQGSGTENPSSSTPSKFLRFLPAIVIKGGLVGPGDVITVSYFEMAAGQLQGVQLTHENITAGVAAIRALLPIANTISSLDTIISAHSLGTPFGRAIAYTALYEGASFVTLESASLSDGAQGWSITLPILRHYGLRPFFSRDRQG